MVRTKWNILLTALLVISLILQAGTGNAAAVISPLPFQVGGPVVAGDGNSFAVRSDGTLWAWGANDYGQLGVGSTDPVLVPTQVPGLRGVTSIVPARYNTYVLLADGSVWGMGAEIKKGAGREYALTPVPVLQDGSVKKITSGEFRELTVLKTDGTVWSWQPWNDIWKQASLADVKDIAGQMALGADGSVYTWGSNDRGQLGNGVTDGKSCDISQPARVALNQKAVAIAAGLRFDMALAEDGTVWTWGDNFYGQLGDGVNGLNKSYDLMMKKSEVPFQVPNIPKMAAIGAGFDTGYALTSDGAIWIWGTVSGLAALPPKVLQPFSEGKYLSAGFASLLGVKKDGTLWGWGRNVEGQVGNGTQVLVDKPTAVMLPEAAAESAPANFADLNGHWARSDIEAFVEKGWISGYPDGTIRPDSPMTRAEYLKLVAVATGGNAGAAAGMYTTGAADGGSWYRPYVTAALQQGILRPEEAPGGSYDGDQPITRQELAVFSVRSISVSVPGGDWVNEAANLFPDLQGLGDPYKSEAAAASRIGIVEGDSDGLALARTATRAESVIMLRRAMALRGLSLDVSTNNLARYGLDQHGTFPIVAQKDGFAATLDRVFVYPIDSVEAQSLVTTYQLELTHGVKPRYLVIADVDVDNENDTAVPPPGIANEPFEFGVYKAGNQSDTKLQPMYGKAGGYVNFLSVAPGEKKTVRRIYGTTESSLPYLTFSAGARGGHYTTVAVATRPYQMGDALLRADKPLVTDAASGTLRPLDSTWYPRINEDVFGAAMTMSHNLADVPLLNEGLADIRYDAQAGVVRLSGYCGREQAAAGKANYTVVFHERAPTGSDPTGKVELEVNAYYCAATGYSNERLQDSLAVLFGSDAGKQLMDLIQANSMAVYNKDRDLTTQADFGSLHVQVSMENRKAEPVAAAVSTSDASGGSGADTTGKTYDVLRYTFTTSP